MSPLHSITGLVFVVSPAVGFQQSNEWVRAPMVVADEFHRFERLLDFNGDGVPDALDWWWTSIYHDGVKVHGWSNDGSGKLTASWQLDLANLNGDAYSSATGDLDNDGRDDFALSFYNDVYLFLSRDPKPQQWTKLSTTLGVVGVVIADFNQDGWNDIATWDQYRIEIFENPGNGQPPQQVESYNPGGGGENLRFCEVNGDSTPDLMFVRGVTILLLKIIDCQVVAQTLYVHGLNAERVPVAGDVDQDGDQDIVVFDMTRYAVLRRTGSIFVPEAIRDGGPATDFADIDGDGDPDGVCCGGGDGLERNQWTSTYRMSLNDGTGGFAPAIEVQGLGAHHLAGVADLDLDGDLDFVGGRCVLFGRGPFTADPIATFSASTLTAATTVDYDRDSDPDFGLSLASVLRNDGRGQVESKAPSIPAPPPGTRFEGSGFLGDFDGDGDVDLIVSHKTSGGQFLAMRLIANQGGGGFLDAGDAAAPGVDFNWTTYPPLRNNPDYAVAADGDGDGDVDLFVTNKDDTWTWWNQGAGFFQTGPFFDESLQAIAHLNGDSHVDLVLMTPYPGYRLGVGSGTFSDAVLLPGMGPMDPTSDVMAVADFTGDGFADVCAADEINGFVVLCVNDGNAGFTSERVAYGLDIVAWSRRVLAADLDGDGRNDLLAWPRTVSPDTAIVRLRNAAGTGFLPEVQFVVDPGTFTDVDGDGDADLVGKNLHLGTRFEAPRAGYRRQYGEGAPGSGGAVPVLGASGPFRTGQSAELVLSGAVGGTFALLVFGLNESDHADFPKPGIQSYCDPWLGWFLIPVSGPPGVPGAGLSRLPYSVPAQAAGYSFFHQVLVYDPGAPYRLSATNGLELHYRFPYPP